MRVITDTFFIDRPGMSSEAKFITPQNRMPQNRNAKIDSPNILTQKNSVLETIFCKILQSYYHLKFGYPKIALNFDEPQKIAEVLRNLKK